MHACDLSAHWAYIAPYLANVSGADSRFPSQSGNVSHGAHSGEHFAFTGWRGKIEQLVMMSSVNSVAYFIGNLARTVDGQCVINRCIGVRVELRLNFRVLIFRSLVEL